MHGGTADHRRLKREKLSFSGGSNETTISKKKGKRWWRYAKQQIKDPQRCKKIHTTAREGGQSHAGLRQKRLSMPTLRDNPPVKKKGTGAALDLRVAIFRRRIAAACKGSAVGNGSSPLLGGLGGAQPAVEGGKADLVRERGRCPSNWRRAESVLALHETRRSSLKESGTA